MADVTITPANVVPPTTNTTAHYQPFTVVAGEAINAGAVVCLGSDGKIYNAISSDTTKQAVIGIAGNSAVAAGQRVDIITASPALAVGTHGVAVGTPLYSSTNSGKMCPFGDLSGTDLPTLVAYAATTTTLQVIIAASANPL